MLRILCISLLVMVSAPAQESPVAQLRRYLNGIGMERLRERDKAVAQLTTREAIERRQKRVRALMLEMIGGLPNYRGPLNAKQAGVLKHPLYRIEKVIYESLPGFYVTANVYVPAGSGPFPAILKPVGHGAGGKAGERETAIGLAQKGFIVLTYDPIGQGERLQYYDPDLRASKVGGPTEEHSHANGHTMLVGDNVSRYRIWDGMRGIDYLVSRKDVDANRIGCTGCSGGGTLTTYISVLDERVKVSAPACYITSWEALFNGPGPQDAEQVLPGFVANGLNFGDYAEAFAPKPWLIASTSEDFFPLAGAKQTFEEAKRIYGVMGAEDRVAWFVGPGGHGVPKPSREAIYAWFIKWLKNGEGDAKEGELDPDLPDELLCTPTGQVADSLHGESVWSLNRKRADGIARTNPVLASAIRAVTLTTLNPGGAPPEMKVLDTAARTGYRLETVSFETVPGVAVTGLLAVPEGDARKPGAVLADPRPKAVAGAAGGDLDQLARAGYVVFSIQPRGVADGAAGSGRQQQGFVSGQGLFALASVVGRTLVGMRIEDIIRATDYLVSRPDVDRAKIVGGGRGVLGVPMLHAAVLDSRLKQTVLQESLESYRAVVDRPVHRNIYETGLYGVLRGYDLPDLEQSLAAKRPVTVLNPVDPLGLPVRGKRTRATLYSSLTVR